ncbi:MAG: bis(5'-nucleosyl)-tetraphosphatase (symmetrical) YqeK [Clostridia bacterium]|nr:bis(5'-nucleosyl)-tetraphosphatase (symmetrical) YqeK [Clostridia bacterium]
MSRELYEHCLRTSKFAGELARRFDVEVDKAERAGLLHDFCKEWPIPTQLAAARRLGLWTREFEAQPKVLHGPLAARVLPEELGEADPAVLSAVARHTTGAPGMSRLDMVVYLADMLEPARDFPGADELRASLGGRLETAMLRALEHTLHHLIDRGAWIHPDALLARNDLLRFRE